MPGLVRLLALTCIILISACSDPPITPDPINPPPPPPPPPSNSPPRIESLTAQGTRRNEPSNFADLGEAIEVAAVVRDDETAVDQLQYNWTATLGGFSGSGARVVWQAPGDAPTATTVTLTLEVVERYATNLENRVSRTALVALHNSIKEIGDMSRQFLIDFSTTSLKDWRVVMRNFKEAACPPSNEYRDERDQVENHYTNFTMHAYEVGPASVSTNFGGSCYAGVRGDACVSVPVRWDSTDIRTASRRQTRGVDHLTAAYSIGDDRWWLCSSRFAETATLGHRFYSR